MLALPFVAGAASTPAQHLVAAQSRVVMPMSDGDAAKWNLAFNNELNLRPSPGPVPSGVVEIMQRQQQSWARVRP